MKTTHSLNELAATIDTYEGMLSMMNNGDHPRFDEILNAYDDACAAYNARLIEMGE